MVLSTGNQAPERRSEIDDTAERFRALISAAGAAARYESSQVFFVLDDSVKEGIVRIGVRLRPELGPLCGETVCTTFCSQEVQQPSDFGEVLSPDRKPASEFVRCTIKPESGAFWVPRGPS